MLTALINIWNIIHSCVYLQDIVESLIGIDRLSKKLVQLAFKNLAAN